MPYIWQGKDAHLNLSATDPDGDSLTYALVPSYSDSNVVASYSPGYSPASPLGPTWTVTLDPHTGMLHCLANPGDMVVGVVAVKVSEYRNGNLIGTLTRDYTVTVVPYPSNSSPTFHSLTHLSSNVVAIGSHVYTCDTGSICFDIPVADVDPGQAISLYWLDPIPGATFTHPTNASIQDTITGTSGNPPVARLCWTPPSNGTYFLHMRVVDNACPLLGVADEVISLHVGGGGPSLASATLGNCPTATLTAHFAAQVCGAGPFSFAWSGAGGLSDTLQSFDFTYTAPGTYPWQVIVSNGSSQDTIYDTLTLVGQAIHLPTMVAGNGMIDYCLGLFTDSLTATGAMQDYAWSTGATTPSSIVAQPGTYFVDTRDSAGCMYTDTLVVLWNQPDIMGRLTSSATLPMVGEKVYLIRHDTSLNALIAVDSAITIADGAYFFCNVTDTLLFLKAAPDSANYPTEMPTYADTTLFWNSAISFNGLTMLPLVHDFSTLYGSNPGGPGFIGGLISQGANKTGSVGDPVPGLQVFLRDQATGAILGHDLTDANGYFSFAQVPLGTYEIVPDKPQVSTTNVPQVALSSQVPIRDSLNLRLHSTYLELLIGTSILLPAPAFSVNLTPNPFHHAGKLRLQLPVAAAVDIHVMDALGRQVEHVISDWLDAGAYEFPACERLGVGLYHVRVHVDGHLSVLRVMKAE